MKFLKKQRIRNAEKAEGCRQKKQTDVVSGRKRQKESQITAMRPEAAESRRVPV